MSDTRQVVLEAARARFARDGYSGATIRGIAADAGVDAALVLQFFSSKEELFAAVRSIPPGVLERLAGAFDGPQYLIGERVARAHLGVWEGGPEESEPLLAMLRGAIANEQATEQLRDFIEARLLEDLRPELRQDSAGRTRAGLAASMLVGVIVGRRIVGVPTLVEVDTEALVRLLAPALQAVLTGPLDDGEIGEGSGDAEARPSSER